MSYISKLFSTGAVRETPGKVMQAMLTAIEKRPYKTIVEIGAGKGELTDALLKLPVSFHHYHAFEIDEDACFLLKKKFPNIVVHQSSAFDFRQQLSENQKVSLFLSSIPLSFYSKEKVKSLLNEIKGKLEPDGKIIIIFSAVWLIPLFKQELPGSNISGFFTFPLYFVLSYQA